MSGERPWARVLTLDLRLTFTTLSSVSSAQRGDAHWDLLIGGSQMSSLLPFVMHEYAYMPH